jgi:succinate dehydrogenase/fumarate reductase cytochrome b subunit
MAQGLVGSIVAAYSDLRAAQAQQEARVSEPRILFYAFLVGCLLFVAGLPTARMQATFIDQPNALVIVLAARFFGALFVLPLLFYAIAAIAHIIARISGATGTFQVARLSLFWALVVTMPVVILASIAAVILVQLTDRSMNLLGLVVLLAFARIWGEGLAQAEGFSRSWPVSLVIAAIPIASFLTISGIQT